MERLITGIPLFFLTGFLGSGKTTVLNAILARLDGRRAGVLVNDWGKVPIDGHLVQGITEGSVVEIPGGQIFCSCVSGSFIEGIAALAERGPELILVEASGLARPGPMDDIVSGAVQRTAGRARYGATICVVDAVRFGALSVAVAAAREQAARADILVLAKTDLASAEQRDDALTALNTLRGQVSPIHAVRGELPASFVQDLMSTTLESPPIAGPGVIQPGWGPSGRPGSITFTPPRLPSEDELRRFLEALAPSFLRVKGIVRISGVPDGSLVLAETAGPLVSVSPVPSVGSDAPTPLVLIGGGKEAEGIVRGAWEDVTVVRSEEDE